MKLNLKILISYVLLNFSCKKISNQDNRTEIVSLISNEIIEKTFRVLPPIKKKSTTEEEQRYKKALIISESSKQRTIAIKLNTVVKNNKTHLNHCEKFEYLNNKLNNNEKSHNININRLDILKHKIIKFDSKMIIKNTKDYMSMGFELLLQFSPIVINQLNTEAAVIVYAGTSTLSSATSVYFLKKINNKWQIVCIEGLFIS